MNKMKIFQILFIIMNDLMTPHINYLPTYHLSRTPQHPRQSKHRPSLRFKDVLVTLLVSLNHVKGRGFTFHSKKILIQLERHENTLFWLEKNCEEMENIGV